jgi:hypothetical protein
VAVFPEWNAQIVVFVALDDLERQASSRALQKTEVKGCGEAMSRDRLLQLFTLHHFLCTNSEPKMRY